MPQTLNFFSQAGSDLFFKVTGVENGRSVATVGVTLTDEISGEPRGSALRLHLRGPADVDGLQPHAVIYVAPKPWTRDAETTKLAHVDFAEIDLPWRYAPLRPGQLRRPWLVLITGTTRELELVNGILKFKDDAVLTAHDLRNSFMWAHVQEEGGREIARLVSPRGRETPSKQLEPNQEYIAALIPAFTAAGEDAWEVSGQIVTRGPEGSMLPTYYAWRYWTAEAGDFETIAARLHSVQVEGLGRSSLRYQRELSPEAGNLENTTLIDETLEIRGAITSLAGRDAVTQQALIEGKTTTWPLETDPASQSVINDLDTLNDELVDPLGRPVIGLPGYGRPWIAEPAHTDWGRLLNGDPRFRGIAGLGSWLAIVAQEELVEEARKQVGALEEAAQRVRQLVAGLSSARSLWKRRLSNDAAQRLLLFGPTLRRIPATDGGSGRGSAIDLVTGETRSLSQAILSTAARRLLRSGEGITRHAKPGAAHPSALLEQSNKCPPLPAPSQAHAIGILQAVGLEHLQDLLAVPKIPGPVREKIREIAAEEAVISVVVIERMIGLFMEFVSQEDSLIQIFVNRLRPHLGEVTSHPVLEEAICPFFGNALRLLSLLEIPPDDWIGILDPLCRPLDRPCHPVDLTGLDGRVGELIDPTQDRPPAVDRIQVTIEGVDITKLEPVEVCIGLEYEVWKLLRDKSKSWLLPGIEELEKDAVVAMESNPAFIDALLVGLNTQLLGEFHWRNMAIAPKCTPLRWFWGKFDHAANKRMDDIRGIDLWQDTRLGDNQHQVLAPDDSTGNRDLVMVFKTDLFRRYPSTLVYLSPMNNESLLQGGTPDFVNGPCLAPKVKGTISDEVTFFIFDINPDKLPEYYVVLDEPPAELRFRTDTPFVFALPNNNSASFAAAVVDTPTRVVIDGEYLNWQGLPQ